ncbi:MAG TPA: LodA/GoxA family CTQ-dependent oxidase [Blastocatellia bacterium]|nr:LodA/GoxA family CTQ-dependent oxidase [Blastocatellia bacterium]
MGMTFKIHPAIGIARVGDSPTDFYLAPEEAGALPIECDHDGKAVLSPDGKEQPIKSFKDAEMRVKRQAARFRVYAYDGTDSPGHEVQIGETLTVVNTRSGQTIEGELTDIQWTVYLANKKASWYEFQELAGETGYAPGHPLRNAGITGSDARQKLIIDPGPQTVSYADKKHRSAEFAKGKNPGAAQTFPPPLNPFSIETLGEVKTNVQDKYDRLIVLGGFGRSGSSKTGFVDPLITQFANNDGWFDDVADGPVTASLALKVKKVDGRDVTPDSPGPKNIRVPVDSPAWVITGYPRYVPEIVDMVTMDDIVYDVAIRFFAYNTNIYGVAPFDGTAKPPTTDDELHTWRELAVWNPDYYPWFYRDIWPILERPDQYKWVMDFDPFAGGDPHDTGPGGNLDETQLATPPYEGEPPADRARRAALRRFVYQMLRKPGEENLPVVPLDNWKVPSSIPEQSQSSTYQRKSLPFEPKEQPLLMPFLCGDNPLQNVVVSKFLRLTDTQLFLLRQWAAGKFIDEKKEDFGDAPSGSAAKTGVELDRGVLSNLLGGAFCPGGEACWIMRNPEIYSGPYRIKQKDPKTYSSGDLSLTGNVPGQDDTASLTDGLEPGDITKYDAVPWQADFNECSTQEINVTYEEWNKIYPGSIGSAVVPSTLHTYWWPAHRPVEVNIQTSPDGGTAQVLWALGIPQNHEGDLKMVSAWNDLGFILKKDTKSGTIFVQVERNDQALPPQT